MNTKRYLISLLLHECKERRYTWSCDHIKRKVAFHFQFLYNVRSQRGKLYIVLKAEMLDLSLFYVQDNINWETLWNKDLNCMQTWRSTHKHRHTWTYRKIHMNTQNIYTHAHIYIHTHTYAQYIHTCMYMYIYMYTHVYTNTHAQYNDMHSQNQIHTYWVNIGSLRMEKTIIR